jgi:hypothetical protein
MHAASPANLMPLDLMTIIIFWIQEDESFWIKLKQVFPEFNLLIFPWIQFYFITVILSTSSFTIFIVDLFAIFTLWKSDNKFQRYIYSKLEYALSFFCYLKQGDPQGMKWEALMPCPVICVTQVLVLCRSNRKGFLEKQLGGIPGQHTADESLWAIFT